LFVYLYKHEYAYLTDIFRYITMKLSPPSGNVIEANNEYSGRLVTQQIRLVNSLQGQKPMMMKLKIAFNRSNGESVAEQATVSSFPGNL
jgi:hypothetical protein